VPGVILTSAYLLRGKVRVSQEVALSSWVGAGWSSGR
jgi:uncharacterized membrane protein